MPLPVGAKAPDFTLKTRVDGAMQDVRLSDHLGKDNVVLLFYPGAFTQVCTREMCEVTQGLDKYSHANAQVYGISNDTPWVLEEWAKQLKIGFPLLSDFTHEVAQAYDVVWPNWSGMGPGTARAVFVIDKEGVVRYSEQTPTLVDYPDFGKVERELRVLS